MKGERERQRERNPVWRWEDRVMAQAVSFHLYVGPRERNAKRL